ncbi:MAG TPA: hypothetical protein VF015_13290, partial [Acidimicrobiales bacterium]
LTPPDGAIVDTDTVVVTGELPPDADTGGTVVVNGVTGTFTASHTWTAEIPMTPVGYVTAVEAIYTTPKGDRYIQRSALVNGDKVDDGEFSPEGVGMRFTNAGLAGLGPVIDDLAGASFDISGMILAQDPLIPPTDAGSGVTITGKAYEAGSSGVDVAASSTASGVKTAIDMHDLYLGLDLQLSGLISGPCKLELEIPTTTIDATFDLAPEAADHSRVDVNLTGAPTVGTQGVSYEFISGVCDPSTPLLGSIINSAAGSAIEGTVKGGFSSQLGDPDGTGPGDSPIAEAIETALAQISIAGSVGYAVKANLNAPFTQITEGADAIDFRADADFYSTFGTGPSDCVQPPHAPDFTSSFDIAGAYPTLGGTTPGGNPYGLGLVISSSAFDQLLSVMTECGLLNQDLTEITLGTSTLPVDSTVLAALVPEFGTKLPANTPMLIRIDPQAAPFLTDAASGPGGETAELMLADLHVDFIQPVPASGTIPARELTWLSLAVDAPLGFDLAFDQANGVLDPTITAPPGSAVTTRVQTNAVGTDEATVEAVFSSLFPAFVDGLGGSFAAFPLPDFLGLDLQVVEVARHGNSYALYANLVPVPQTRLANVTVTDLSTADYATDSALFDSREWRHRLRRQVSSTQVKVNLDGMIGADACCTVDDERATAHAGYRVAFDVVPEHGETWKLDMSQLIKGAHTANSEGVGGGYGAQSNISAVTGRYQVDGGAWQTFSFDVGSDGNPAETTPWQGGWCGCAFNEPFIGTSAASTQGTAAQAVVVEFGFDLTAWSDSNLAFPAEAGNESAIRLGANDSLTNNFSVGDYPGQGNRNIVDDGHFASITLSTVGG